MKLHFIASHNKFVCKCSFDNRHVPKDAGFRWHSTGKFWYTDNPGVAAKLIEYGDEIAKKQISKSSIVVSEWAADLSLPDDQKLYPFQETSIRFALARNRSYLGLDPGLGKTPIAAVVAQTLVDQGLVEKIVYVCPPFLTRNTREEFKRWAPYLLAGFLGDRSVSRWASTHLLLVPDSMITREETRLEIERFLGGCKGYKSLLFVDEAHRFKNDTALRTKALLGARHGPGIADQFERIVYMSGTPMPNRPIELYPVLNHSASSTIDHMSKFEYGRKFCAAHQNQWGWDFSGASNMKLLKESIVGPFMLRYRKSEVLTELPPKTEEMVVLGDDLTPKLAKLDRDILKAFSPEDIMEGKFRIELELDDIHLATYRRELGLYKLKAATEYLKYLLEETDESVLIFAIHTDVIKDLEKTLEDFKPLVITGQTPMKDRHEIVKTFQTDPLRRVFIGNIQAAGVGLTLTKATRVVFVEFSWVPSDNDQASDRAHRIGQKDNVLVQYLVFKNSVDRSVIETILTKKKITGQL